MRFIDKILQKWRIIIAAKSIQPNDKVLDIGCFQGEFLEFVEGRIDFGVGIDPLLETESTRGKINLHRWSFQEPLPFSDSSFDSIVMLATIEHIDNRESIARECSRLLKPNGRTIITVPEPAVDYFIEFLVRIRFADGMSLEQHSGFKPDSLTEIFKTHNFRMVIRKKFQLGLNNLFVFEKN